MVYEVFDEGPSPSSKEIPRVSTNYKDLAVTHAPELSLCLGAGCNDLGLDRKIAHLSPRSITDLLSTEIHPEAVAWRWQR
jgi:hypothetical protein